MRTNSAWSRFQDWRGRSGWGDWGLFILAALLAAGLLIVFALSNPIFQGPAPLPESDPTRAKQASAATDQDTPDEPPAADPAVPTDPPPD